MEEEQLPQKALKFTKEDLETTKQLFNIAVKDEKAGGLSAAQAAIAILVKLNNIV